MIRNIGDMTLAELFAACPETSDYFSRYSLPTAAGLRVMEALNCTADQWLRDVGLTREDALRDIEELYVCAAQKKEDAWRSEASSCCNISEGTQPLCSLRICGGRDKGGKPECADIEFIPGDVAALCGNTGAGKTRLLEDIEYVSAGDSVSGRVILLNGKVPDARQRESLEISLCAYLSQSMNFILELTVEKFIILHAKNRRPGLTDNDAAETAEKVLSLANSITGEPFESSSILTQLSGGQSRALMIADIVCVSDSPVVLIDEPENAGIDKEKAVALLSGSGKIVLISTHDPLIALSCPRRIILKNGGISAVVQRTKEELKLRGQLGAAETKRQEMLRALRAGEHL